MFYNIKCFLVINKSKYKYMTLLTSRQCWTRTLTASNAPHMPISFRYTNCVIVRASSHFLYIFLVWFLEKSLILLRSSEQIELQTSILTSYLGCWLINRFHCNGLLIYICDSTGISSGPTASWFFVSLSIPYFFLGNYWCCFILHIFTWTILFRLINFLLNNFICFFVGYGVVILKSTLFFHQIQYFVCPPFLICFPWFLNINYLFVLVFLWWQTNSFRFLQDSCHLALFLELHLFLWRLNGTLPCPLVHQG